MLNVKQLNRLTVDKANKNVTILEINSFMLINEVIRESDINTVWTTIASPIQQLYRNLDDLADKLYSQGKMSSFDFVAGSAKSRWVEKFIKGEARERGRAKEIGILPHLRSLAKNYPESAEKLKLLLQNWDGKFNQLEAGLTIALIELGEAIDNNSLVTHARAWQKKAQELRNKVADLKDREEYSTTPSPEENPVARKRSLQRRAEKALQGEQRQQAEQIMSAVLAELPRQERHAIRQAVIGKSNPLQALKAELEKRNISI